MHLLSRACLASYEYLEVFISEFIFELTCIWNIWIVTDLRNKLHNYSNFLNNYKTVEAYDTIYVHQITLRI